MANVTSVRNGGKVHASSAGGTPCCSPWQGDSKFKTTNAPVDCKKCIANGYEAKHAAQEEPEPVAAALAPEFVRTDELKPGMVVRLKSPRHPSQNEAFTVGRIESKGRSEYTIYDAEGNGRNYWAARTLWKLIQHTTGENMATKVAEQKPNTDEILEEINGNIERVKSLVEADNADGVAELSAETEELISKLPQRGKINDQTATQAKKELRAGLKAAGTAQEKPKAKSVAKKAAPSAPVAGYDQYKGVPELVAMGAERVAEGVRLQIETATTAKDIASIGLDMWRRIPDKDGNPDINGKSNDAKKASSDLKKAAGEALGRDGNLSAFDVDQALKSLWRSVQTQRTDVRAQYLRSLDDDSEEAAAERERFAAILKDKPEDVAASEWVANHYGVGLKGEIEKSRDRYAKKALASGESSESDDDSDTADDTADDSTPDERVAKGVKKLLSDVRKVRPEDFEAASEEAKKAARAELEKLNDAIKDMIKATL